MTDKSKSWANPQPTVDEALEFVDGGWPGSTHAISYPRAGRALATEVLRLREEIEVLRLYGNKDCTHMADAELSRRRAVAPHKHRGSVTVDRGETCLDCGRDMSDPVHIG